MGNLYIIKPMIRLMEIAQCKPYFKAIALMASPMNVKRV